MLHRLLEVKSAIIEIMADSGLNKVVEGMPADARSKFETISGFVNDRNFWKKIAALVELSGPIMNVLRLCDGDIPATGKVYNEMFVLGELLDAEMASDSLDFVPVATMRSIRIAVRKRWTDLHNPLHGAGYLLDPEFHSKVLQHVPRDCLSDLMEVAAKIFGEDHDKAAVAVRDWQTAYKERKGIFQRDLVWANSRSMPPESWYDQYVKPFHPELGTLGMKVLSQVISASSCERNWSQHGHIHTDLRNRLAPQKVEKAVYVFANSKVIRQDRSVDFKMKMYKWDEDDDEEA